MTYIHWMQAIWIVSMCCVWAQIYWLERTRRKLRKQSERLEITQAFITNAANSWRELTTRADEKSDQATPPSVH